MHISIVIVNLLFYSDFTTLPSHCQEDEYNLQDTECHCFNCAKGRGHGRAQRRRNAWQTQEKREKAEKYDNEIGEKQVSWMCSGYYSFEFEGHRLLVKCILKGKKVLKVPYVCLQQNRDSNMPHCSSYACSNSTVKDSINKLSFGYPLNRPELKQWPSGFVGIVTDTRWMPHDRVGLT